MTATVAKPYDAARGYTVGPTLDLGALPWPPNWDATLRVDDHVHAWESVLWPGYVDDAGVRLMALAELVRCARCHAPRCSADPTEPDPCTRRRRHRGEHLRLSELAQPRPLVKARP